MRTLIVLLMAAVLSTTVQASDESGEKSIQHLKVADVTSIEDARKIFIEKTSEIRSKRDLDEAELQQIHVITYTLEKSVEFFTFNLIGDNKKLADDLAVVVENIHLNSERNRKEQTKKHLNQYFVLADRLIASF
ncbi:MULTISPECIES: DUF6746 family protein [Pseudoalteromonas]|uniref:Uncharacterized protein n=1 Tax=Pseudoalteromonas rubra TaxID=43658 RepID=A0A0L0EX61_9GAMM|nr:MULTISPECIES: DUF6746 family protein [Pseudoalteromonas]ALU44197.1 hypothetical protein AT705_15305 [Pseudoalteromonas rubra]KNC68423.1 hypothetical protein AC626_04720 [Pseudoalteromonas rubra]MDK1312083.1 hypothetical protein [Pseudoalteromonas sp. R96]